MKALNLILSLPLILFQGFWYIEVAHDFDIAREKQRIERRKPDPPPRPSVEKWCEEKLFSLKNKKKIKRQSEFFKKIMFVPKCMIRLFLWSTKMIIKIFKLVITEHMFVWTLFSAIWFQVNTTSICLLTKTLTNMENYIIWPLIVIIWLMRLKILKAILEEHHYIAKIFLELLTFVNWSMIKHKTRKGMMDICRFKIQLIWDVCNPEDKQSVCFLLGCNWVLLGAIKKLHFSKLYGCMVVAPEESSTSNSSNSTESSMEESLPAHEVPHEFIVNDKIHNKGPEKGEKYQTVSLCVFPYMFRKRYVRKDITTFTCNGCEKFRQATIATAKLDEDNDWFLLTNPSKHLCSPSSTAHQKAEFSRKLYQKVAEDPRASLPKLYDELKLSMISGMDTETRKSFLKKISKFANIKRGLYQFRKHFIPRNPDKMEGFDAEHAWLNISKKESLIKGDVPVKGGRVLIMSSVQSLKRFARAYAFAVDGTFKICPRLWYQLIIINAQIGPNTWVPVCYGYLPNKKLETYNAFFKGVKDSMTKHNISKDDDILAAQYVMADWEINLRKALKLAFPKVDIKGW